MATSTNPAHRITNAITTRTTTRQHTALAGASVASLAIANGILNASYEASNHPVSYAEGQLAFNGDTIKGYYAHMSELGTLDTYVTTQLIDFGFIAAMICIGLFFATRIARMLTGTRAASAAAWASTLFVVGASFDAIENLISFVMLANPTGFADAIALPYSTMAALKFLAIAAAAFLTLGAGAAAAARKISGIVGRARSLAI